MKNLFIHLANFRSFISHNSKIRSIATFFLVGLLLIIFLIGIYYLFNLTKKPLKPDATKPKTEASTICSEHDHLGYKALDIGPPYENEDQVRHMQQDLLNLGYKLPQFGVDGKYGPETKTAVSEFIKNNDNRDSKPDGSHFGKTLWELLAGKINEKIKTLPDCKITPIITSIVTPIITITPGDITTPTPHILKVITYNIHRALGLNEGVVNFNPMSTQGKAAEQAIAKVIKDSGADVALLQEVDSPGQTERLAKAEATGLTNWSEMMYGEYGVAILSKNSITSKKNYTFKSQINRPLHKYGVSEVVIDISGYKVVVISTHLEPGHDSPSAPDIRIKQIDEIKKQLEASKYAYPIIIGGDFNEPPTNTNGVYTHATSLGWVDAWNRSVNGFTFKSNWIVGKNNSTYKPKRLDYLFSISNPNGDTAKAKNARVIETQASDHLPVYVEFTFSK